MALKYLSNKILKGFDRYKYKAVDTSPISKYICHPFWNFVVEFVPRSVAPNTLTLSGFLFLVVEFIVLSYYDRHFFASSDSYSNYPPIPRWVWLLSCICMFMAHTLDGIDGKQARRTGTSSPLGELFDHGLDSMATFLMPLGMYDVFGREAVSPDRVYLVIVGVMITFASTHWEKYNTGYLYLPLGYDLSQMAMTAIFLVTYLCDYSIWNFHVPLLNISSGRFFEIIMHISVFVFSVPVSMYNVYLSYQDGSGKNRTLYEAMRPMVPYVFQFSLLLTWVNYSTYDIIMKEPRLFYTVTGLLFSNITCRLIVSQMSDTRCQIFNWLLLPLFVIVLGVLCLPLGAIEVYLLWTYALLVFAVHMHYAIGVVHDLATHLNVYVFSVQKPLKATT